MNVSGQWSEMVTRATADCGDNLFLLISPESDSPLLTQQSSGVLNLSGVGPAPMPMPGILHSDGSATFGPIQMTFFPVDGDGNPDPNGVPEPGKMYLNGWFTGAPGEPADSFEGTYSFIADYDGCQVDSPTQWLLE
jgi:hypothetical protein